MTRLRDIGICMRCPLFVCNDKVKWTIGDPRIPASGVCCEGSDSPIFYDDERDFEAKEAPTCCPFLVEQLMRREAE